MTLTEDHTALQESNQGGMQKTTTEKNKKNKQDEYHTMHKLMHTSELHAVQKIQAIYIDIYICVYINMYIYIYI